MLYDTVFLHEGTTQSPGEGHLVEQGWWSPQIASKEIKLLYTGVTNPISQTFHEIAFMK